MGLKEGVTFNLWVITAGSIPPMSSCFKANTSSFCFKKGMRRSLTSSVNLDPIWARCSGWPSSCTGSSSSEGVGQVFNSSLMSSSSMWMLLTTFCFIDAK